jgi:hypothetical protein
VLGFDTGEVVTTANAIAFNAILSGQALYQGLRFASLSTVPDGCLRPPEAADDSPLTPWASGLGDRGVEPR